MFKYILLALMLVAPGAWAADAIDLGTPVLSFDNTNRISVNSVNGAPITGGEVRLLATASPIAATGKYFSVVSRQGSTLKFGALPDSAPWIGAKGGVSIWAEDSDGKVIAGSKCSGNPLIEMPTLDLKFNLGSSQTFGNTTCPAVEWQFTSAGTGGSGGVVIQVNGDLAADMQVVLTAVTDAGVSDPGAATANYNITKFAGPGRVKYTIPFTIADNTEVVYDWALGGSISTTGSEF